MNRSARRRVLLAIAALLSTLFALGCAEVALRVLGIDTPARRHFSPGIYRADPELLWVLESNYVGAHLEYDGPIASTTNAQGFRGPEWTPERAAASTRILVLGDSCTYGRGVADGEDYPARVEVHLRERGRDVAVFNAGVPGYDTVQEAGMFARLADSVRPTVVVVGWLPNDVLDRSVGKTLQVLDGQLVADVDRYRAWRAQVEHGGIFASALYRFLRVRLDRLSRGAGLKRSRWDVDIDAEGLAYSQDALLQIKRRADALGASLLLVLFPREEEVRGQGGGHHEAMEQFATEHGIGVVNPLRAWGAEPHGDAGRYLPGDEVHLTARGYDDLARAIADHPLLAAPDEPNAPGR